MSAKAAAWCRGARAGKGQRQPLLRAPRDTESRRGHLNEGWTDSSPEVARVPPAREEGCPGQPQWSPLVLLKSGLRHSVDRTDTKSTKTGHLTWPLATRSHYR